MKSKQVLSIEQMQHLQDLGLDTSNASMVWGKYDGEEEYSHLLPRDEDVFERCLAVKYIPAYTSQDVLDAMTRWEINDGFCPRITIDLSERLIRYHYKDKGRVGMVMKSFDGNGTGCLIDAAYEMLCWSIGKKFVETNKK